MATQQVKKTVTTRTYQSEAAGDAGSPIRGREPSPARISRGQEKAQLTSLNDRLAAYIDHIRSLETENQKLHLQVQSFEETSSRHVNDVKDMYEKELAATRKLIDDLSKDNAQLTISVGTYKSEAEEWMRKYNRKDRDLTVLEKKYNEVDSLCTKLQADCNLRCRERDDLQAENSKLRTEVADLERQLAAAKKQLEEQLLAKVDLENKISTLKEELSFKAALHLSELNETRTRMEYTMSEVDSRTQHEVETRLQDALAEFREQHTVQTVLLREELENLYESKISGLQKELAGQDHVDDKTRNEIQQYKSRSVELQNQVNKLTTMNSHLEARVADLEAQLAAERDANQSALASREKEIRFLREEMNGQMKEYQDLLDVKISLDLEISAYRKLLEGEEERLNLSQSFNSSQVKSGGTPRKRRRTGGPITVPPGVLERGETEEAGGFSRESNVNGPLEISEVDELGKYIRVTNTTEEEIHLKGWKVVHVVEGKETEYKFHAKTKLEPGQAATIWSADCGAWHDAATHNLVMKNQAWDMADETSTRLERDGETLATLGMKRSRSVVRAVRKAGLGRTAARDEPDSSKCLIM